MVVDDDSDGGNSLAVLLEVQGFTVTVARNGQEALDHLRAGPLPDLILLDLMMPVMNGWQFREEQLRDERLADVPVVVLSAVGEAAERQDLLGDVGYLRKPIDVDRLHGAIYRFTTTHKPEVLVVEDEAGVRAMLEMALRHHGLAVLSAASGQQALDLTAAASNFTKLMSTDEDFLEKIAV